MEFYRYHIFICTSTTCAEGDPFNLRLKMHRLLVDKYGFGYEDHVRITKTLCLGQCGLGPNMVVYPEGIWYKGIKPQDIEEIVESHLINGKPVERLILYRRPDQAPVKNEI